MLEQLTESFFNDISTIYSVLSTARALKQFATKISYRKSQCSMAGFGFSETFIADTNEKLNDFVN